MLKVGLSSYSLWQAVSRREMDIFDVIDFIAEHGGKHIEIVPAPGYYDINGNDKLAADIVKAAGDAGIEISGYTIGANFLTPANGVKAEIERVKTEIDTAAKLGVTRMRHDLGSSMPDEAVYERFEEKFSQMTDICGELADYAGPCGITTSVENHGVFFQQSERLQRLILAVGRDNFRTTLDVGNFLCIDQDPVTATMDNIRFASMIHFKDFHIYPFGTPPVTAGYYRTTHHRYIRGAVTGDGDVNLPAIVKVIKNSGYDGFLSIEYEGWDECRKACDRAMKNVMALLEQN